MAEYKGSIELISGLTQKNNQDFPLVNAKDVAIYKKEPVEGGTEEVVEYRLDTYLDNIGISEDDRKDIIKDAAEAVFEDNKYKTLSSTVESNATSLLGVNKALKEIEDQLGEGDNNKLKVQYEQTESLLYLFEGDELIKPNPDEGIVGNVISTTTVTGGGSGTSLNYRLTLKVLDPSLDITFTKSDKAVIHYRADFIDTTALEGEDNLVPATLNFRLTITSPTGSKKNYTFKGESNKDLEYDLTKLLALGSNEVQMFVSYTEDIDGTPVTIQHSRRWIVKVVNMYLTSTYDDSVVRTGATTIYVTAFGDLDKILHWIIDGDNHFQKSATLANWDYDVPIPAQSHGSHTVEIYLTAIIGEKEITSPSLHFDIMFEEAGNTTPIIRVVPQTEVRQQYTTIPIEYSVYQSTSISSEINLKAISENRVPVLDENGIEQTDPETGEVITELVITEEFNSTLIVDRNKQIWNYTPALDGKKILTFTCGDVVKTLTFEVEKFPYTITPVTNGLELDFNPEGRTNRDSNYDEFNYNGYDWILSDNFDWSNGGWKTDENNATYFCIKAGTTATFNYPLFGDENTVGTAAAQGNGKEFKLIFKTTNVAKADATWLTCMAETEKFKPVGIQMDMHNGYISSDLNKLTIPYSEEDVIEFDMNIVPFGSKDEKDIPMIMTYEDGTPVQPIVLTDSSVSFTQAQPVPITIGSPHCDVHIYRMKAYSSFLSDKQILNNFIADATTGTEKANRYLRNQIYNAATGQLTPEDLAEACPDLKVIMLSVPRFTTDKKDYVNDSRFKMIHKGGRPEDNWEAIQCIHSGQGTSSNEYGFAGRNLDLIMKKQKSDKGGLEGFDPIITLESGEVVSKITLAENSVPTNYLNVKVNIASSENSNNALLQKRFNRYLPYTPGSHVHDKNAKNTMEFYNCVIFVQERGKNDLTGNTEARSEFSDDGWHFYAIGNVGDSKKTDSTRTSDPDDTNEFCVEIMDWNRELSSFPEDTKVPANAVKYQETDDKTGITTYYFLNDEYLQNGWLYEKIGGTYNALPQDIKFVANKYYFELVDGNYLLTTDSQNHNTRSYYELIDGKYTKLPAGTLLDPEKTYYDYVDEKYVTIDVAKANRRKTYYEYVGGEYVLSEDSTINFSKVYYVDILEHDDFSEDYTYGWRYIDDDEDTIQVANAKQKWIEFYRYITRDLTYDDKRTDADGNLEEDPEKIAAWKAEFDNWFISDAAFYYYLFTLRYTMVDNRAKNSFWHYGKTAKKLEDGTIAYETDEDGNFVYKFDFWDYDNDTALGIDNAGKLEMSYGVEDEDRDAAGATYFRAADSTFFRRLAKYFSKELSTKYYQYESAASNIFNSTHLLDEFDAWQSQFPEELWRLDYERKYKRTYANGGGEKWDNAIPRDTSDPRFLTDMMNGKKKYQRRQFERNQDFYMSSKFGGTLNFSDRITLRAAGAIDTTNLVVPQDATLYITPYLNMYVKVGRETNGSYYFNQKCEAGKTYAAPYPPGPLEFIYIFGASKVQSIGDLSPFYLQTATLGYGSKLKEAILGNSTPGYKNNAFIDLDKIITSGNKLLEVLNIENIPSFTGSLPITNIPSIKKVYAKGSGITSVTFADHGLIESAELPATVDTLRMNNLYFFNDLQMESYENLLELVQVNTPGIDEKEIVENAPRLNRVRLLNINWTKDGRGVLASTDVLNRLLKCKGVAEDGSNINQSVLTGRVWVPEIRASEKAAYKAAWPELTVEYGGEIQQKQVSFMNEGKPACDPILVDVNTTLSAELHDPVVNGTIPAPTKEQTAQYSYVFDRWEMIDGTKLPGYLIKDNVTFHAKYREIDRYYNVMWYDDDPATTPTAKPLLEQPIKVIYGGSTQYPLEGFPTKNPTGNGDYFLFEKWSEPATNIVADTNIYGIWATSNTKDLDPKNGTLNLKPIDLFAIKNEPDNSEKSLSKFFKNAGDSIKVQLGYMPDYDDVDSIVFTEAMKKYNGTLSEKVDTGIKLLDSVDKGFTLALDYSVDYSSSRTTLLSCYFPEANGILIEGVPINTVTNTSFTFADTSVDIHHTPITAGEIAHREICVIRKPKGEAKIYIYTNNRYTNDPITRQELIYDSWNDINSTLHFGANVYTIPSTGLVLEDYPAKGSIYYAKLWNDDIGDEECKKVCSWIYDTMEFAFVGSNTKYWMTDSTGSITGLKSKASFMSKQLLDEPVKFNISYSTDKVYAGYSQSDIRKWLNDKVFKGMDPQWRQLMQSVRITSLQGISNQQDLADAYADPSILIRKKVNTSDYLYLPSAKELSPSFPNEGGTTKPTKFEAAYREEMSPNDSSYELFGTPSSRVKTLSHSNLPAGYWTRSPWFPSEGSPNFYAYHYGVAPGNTASTGSYSYAEPGGLTHIYTTSDNPNNLKYFRRDNALNTIAQGVPICFSI